MKYFLAMFFALSSLSAGCGTYFDTGAFNPRNFLVWSNPDDSEVLNLPLYETYLEGLFSSLEQNDYDAIYLAFSQIADIDYLADPSSWSSGKVNASDVYIKNLLMQIYQNCPQGTMELFFNTFISYAHKHNVKVYLSFGGEAASGVKICPNPQDAADQQARKLASYLIDFNFDGADFDLEDGAISQNNTQEEIDTFFSTLKMELQAESKTSSLTVMGDIRWATIAGNLKEHFHFVQLMLYGSGGVGGKYYINAVNDTWGITKWIDVVGKENASMICVGFQDDTYYENPSASASGIYIVDPNSR